MLLASTGEVAGHRSRTKRHISAASPSHIRYHTEKEYRMHRSPPGAAMTATKKLTPRQSLVAHLESQHQDMHRGNHRQLALRHRSHHQRVLTHTHTSGDGWMHGGDQRPVRLVLIKPKNPASTKAEDRNWTLQISGHQTSMVQFVRLYSTRDGDTEGAKNAADQWLGYSPEWLNVSNKYLEAKP